MNQSSAGLAKPKLRGVIHLVMSPISLVAGLVMISAASELRGRITLGIFTLTAVTLFTCSALYHRVKWSDKYRGLWRRIDHANIPILIAGTYTPFAVFLLGPSQRNMLLAAVWIGALTTAFLRIVWLKAPRSLYVAAYILLGWAALVYVPTFYKSGGVLVFLLILLGGLFYTAGGIVYALKKPNFNVNWFGFHELFHALTAAAFISHLIAAILTVFKF
ncbi:MAG: hemolysin III family protein [Candidatus Nanopelagicaceae bacterium]